MHHSALRTRLSILMFLQYAFPGALLTLYSVHLEQLGFDSVTIGLCSATQAIGTMLVALIAGQAADRWFAAERCVAACSFFAGIVLLLLTMLDGKIAVFAATLAFWLLAGPTILIGTSICFRHLERPDRDFGSVRLWGTVGWMVPGWLVLAWDRMTGSAGVAPGTGMFRAGSVFAFLLAGYALTLPPTPPQPDFKRKSAPLAALGLLRRRSFLVYILSMFGLSIAYPFTTQATPLLLARLGVQPDWLAPTLTLAQVSEITVLALLPMLLLRLGVRGTMVLGIVALLTVMTVLAIGRPLGLVVGSLGVNGFYVAGFLVAGQVFVNRLAGEGLRASVQALLTFANAAAMLIGHTVVGYLRRVNSGELTLTFTVGAALSAAMLLLFLAGFRERDT